MCCGGWRQRRRRLFPRRRYGLGYRLNAWLSAYGNDGIEMVKT